MSAYLQTGQYTCHDAKGRMIDCTGSGQDAEFARGVSWPAPRFEGLVDTVLDRLTGLTWTRNANLSEFPLAWQEALNYVAKMNCDKVFDYSDWRLPNRRELRSLMSHQTRIPALPEGHPFVNIFSGWYWTSTSAAINTAYAWYIHTEGARMFYGQKEQFFLLWPVRGTTATILPATGQTRCYDSMGQLVSCAVSGQDGEFRSGVRWPEPRFEEQDGAVIDRLTDLCWSSSADLTGSPATWEEALKAVANLNRKRGETYSWRLPNINELESLVDCSSHSPALPHGHPFRDVREGYWSSTTSMFEPDWAWALYLTKGAVGVGQKSGAHFSVWPVCNLSSRE
ncbi:MAG: Lcl C-terminal domain-containing protein [Thermodesulfovibrionales bacterium]